MSLPQCVKSLIRRELYINCDIAQFLFYSIANNKSFKIVNRRRGENIIYERKKRGKCQR